MNDVSIIKWFSIKINERDDDLGEKGVFLFFFVILYKYMRYVCVVIVH